MSHDRLKSALGHSGEITQFSIALELCFSPVMPTSQPFQCPLVSGSEAVQKGKAQYQLCVWLFKRPIASLQ